MEKNNENNGFQYTYSAKEQEELRRIRQKYEAGKEDKMTRLRRLDASVSRKATAAALLVGIIGALVMGLGMSLVMTNMGTALGMTQTLSMIVGGAVGVAGMILIALAYPIYGYALKKQRAKIAPEILKLTDELIK